MSFNGKRKAEDVTFNGFHVDDRPTLKRRGTAAAQLHSESRNVANHNKSKNDNQHEYHGRNDSAMSNHHEGNSHSFNPQLPTPPLRQDEFMNEAKDFSWSEQHQHQHQHQQAQSDDRQNLQTLHATLTTFLNTHHLSSLEPHLPTSPQPQTFLTQTRNLTHHLNSHLTSLQNLAISQLKLRTQMSSLGVTQPVMSNLDLALQSLDAQMMDFMIGLQAIEMEAAAIEADFTSDFHRQSPTHVTEVAML
ncbi:hypothetical protein CERZMDRAFT_94471 [Cercospora zeae-maydis SCOH1-5]|uniref:Uncharacterized protein n=1 Tax=Cercospora zeae-maydis SCOH1-5 TaxID=717836 RepID=A0A6A6FS39_9PEZI|nr:hypothetical protein CERZMDRAFT_94471 [Cercospora zeae-maydis SCOH1-5]